VILITLLSKFETYKYFEISRLRLKKVFYGGLVEIFNSTFERVIVHPKHMIMMLLSSVVLYLQLSLSETGLHKEVWTSYDLREES